MNHLSTTSSPAPRSRRLLAVVAGLVVVVAMTAAVTAQEEPVAEDYGLVKVGESLFRAYCATCHGTTAEGDGPLAESLRVTPANLTVLTQNNAGEFPFERVQMRIDGREKVRGHGPSDMPVWGNAFKQVDEDATEEQVEKKVLALAHYIRSIQTAAASGS